MKKQPSPRAISAASLTIGLLFLLVFCIPHNADAQSSLGAVASACPLTNSANICITSPPYNASVAGATTTTTSGTFGVGTSGAVASCSTFSAGNGIFITGAGTAGANYIGTVVSCNGTDLTVAPATSTSVASGVVVQHDETTAFLAAFAAIAANSRKTGTIWGPDGAYLVNGPLLDTGGVNAILPLPKSTLVAISIKGFTPPAWNNAAVGFNIKTSATTGNLIAGPLPPFTNVKLDIENVTIKAPVNTGAVMVNATNILAFQGRHLLIKMGDFQVDYLWSRVALNVLAGGARQNEQKAEFSISDY
jgi:hypothetical protein